MASSVVLESPGTLVLDKNSDIFQPENAITGVAMSQSENGLVIEKCTVRKAHEMTKIEGKMCCNGIVTDTMEADDSSVSLTEHLNFQVKGNFNPQLSLATSVSNEHDDILGNGIKNDGNIGSVTDCEDNKSSTLNKKCEPGNNEGNAKCENSIAAVENDSKTCLMTEKGEKEAHVSFQEVQSEVDISSGNKNCAEKLVDNILIFELDNCEKSQCIKSECCNDVNKSAKDFCDNDAKKRLSISDSCLDKKHNPENMVFSDSKAEEGHLKLFRKCTNKRDPGISPQIFEDITEDEISEDEEFFENIELELDDLIHPSESFKSSDINEKGKLDTKLLSVGTIIHSEDMECSFSNKSEAENLSQVREDTHFTPSNKDNKTLMAKFANVPDLKIDKSADDLELPKSSSCSIIKQDVESEKKDTQGNIYTVLSSTSTSKAATCSFNHIQKQKFTARKSGKHSRKKDCATLKTINLHPIKNITMKLSDVKEALEYSLMQDTSSLRYRISESDVPNADSNLNGVSTSSEVNSEKNLTASKKNTGKIVYGLSRCKKKPKQTRSGEVEKCGSPVVYDSLSDSSYEDVHMHKDSGSYEESETVPAKHSAVDSIIKNSSMSLSSKVKSSSEQLSSGMLSTVTTLSSSLCSSLTSSRPKKTKSKIKSVLDMLHARSKQQAELENAATTTIQAVSVATSVTTTTILVSPPPNKPIVEGFKRKGTPRKRKEIIYLSDSEDSGDKKVTVEGKKKKDTIDCILSTPLVPISHQQQTRQTMISAASQAPVVMVVAQHSSAPGLRSLLPRHALLSPSGSASGKIVQPAQGGILSSFPLISTLPVGAKAVSLANLPSGVTAVPITSLPPGSQPTVTFFTTVPASVATAMPIPISGANLNSITSPRQLMNTVSKARSLKTTFSSSSSMSTSLTSAKTSGTTTASTNSDSLRALLVGKPYTFTQISTATPTQVASTPMLFQMVTATGTSLVPVPAQSVTLPTSSVPNVLKPLSTMLGGKSGCSLLRPYLSVVPNGTACLIPSKTLDADSSSEVAVAASLSRPVAGQVEDSEVIPLCCCKINGASLKLLSGIIYCQALDAVDSKVLGCCNKVTNPQLVRPGIKIPFIAVCEAHRKRLKLHQCCPGCGHFCTQGKFQQCRKDGKLLVHNFHKACVFFRGGKYYCPHCGEETNQFEVELQLSEEKPERIKMLPPHLTKRNTEIMTARIGFNSFVKSKSATETKTIMLPNDKAINIAETLPLGLDHQTLVKLCQCISEERPKKYRAVPKDLYTPACEGDLEKLLFLLVDGVSANMRYEIHDDQTAMHAAAVSGSIEAIFLLTQFGAEMHVQDKNLKTPLMCAAENGNLKVVQYLIKAGVRVEDRGEDGMTSLHYAAKAGYIDIVHHVLETGKLNVNIQDDGGWSPVMWATELQMPEVVKYLLSQGGDPNNRDNEENTSLHWAAYCGSLTIAEMFLDRGCEIDARNEHGDRPLHIAARQDHYDMVVLLLARGADVDTKNNKNESPVEACTNKSGQVWMALKINQQLRNFAAWKIIHQEQLVERDITMGREKNPIACVNSEDSELCPVDYLYVTKNVETSPLNINYVITSLQSCRCKDDCASMYCVCGRSSIKCWYDKVGRLLDEVNLLEPPLVFECNRACRCWVNCNNRVVQNGITCRLQMFRTNGRGWGVRTLMDIPKGTFVCEYIGELISDSEADRREDDSYLFDLDNKDGDTYCIDARKYGNISRFINHLCEPNLVPVKVFVEHQDLRFPRICLFSSRDINAYEELGFDYGEKFWMIKWKHFTCACKSAKCKYSSETIKNTLADYKLRYPDETMELV